jgi:methionine aminopeptidase
LGIIVNNSYAHSRAQIHYFLDTGFLSLNVRGRKQASAFEAHHLPVDKKIRKGELVNTDFVASFNGYCSDIARMAFVARAFTEIREFIFFRGSL